MTNIDADTLWPIFYTFLLSLEHLIGLKIIGVYNAIF